MLAENTKAYSFPATFLIPFLIEPFVTVIVPYALGKCVVSSHPEWMGRDSELFMVAFEFDMGRYGDLLLDMVLGIMIFFFPGGYTLILFFGMAGSHAYIYCFDHSRVLRTIPKCIYAGMDVDWWGCWMMAPITAMIPMCLVMKANCQDYGYCMKGIPLMESMWFVYILHTVVHTLLLLYVVPMLVRAPAAGEADGAEEESYAKAAERYPCNWFTSNPIHCLRSQHILKQQSYCTFHSLGKSHLLHHNPAIGLHFKEDEAKTETFKSSMGSFTDSFKKKPTTDETSEPKGQ